MTEHRDCHRTRRHRLQWRQTTRLLQLPLPLLDPLLQLNHFSLLILKFSAQIKYPNIPADDILNRIIDFATAEAYGASGTHLGLFNTATRAFQISAGKVAGRQPLRLRNLALIPPHRILCIKIETFLALVNHFLHILLLELLLLLNIQISKPILTLIMALGLILPLLQPKTVIVPSILLEIFHETLFYYFRYFFFPLV